MKNQNIMVLINNNCVVMIQMNLIKVTEVIK